MPKTSRAGSRSRKNRTESLAQSSPGTTAAPAPKALYARKEMTARQRVISLVVGDVLCFLIFVSIGSNQHGKGINILYSLWLSVPFIVAWFIISPFVGVFTAHVATKPTRMIIRTALAWLATWPVAMLFRWLLVERLENPQVDLSSFLSFATVTLAFNMGLLLLWRWPFSLNNDLRKRGL